MATNENKQKPEKEQKEEKKGTNSLSPQEEVKARPEPADYKKAD